MDKILRKLLALCAVAVLGTAVAIIKKRRA